jgi:hypothetical protein
MIITLTTDFGSSEYVGAVKGVIYSICPKARVVDITHGIRKFDVRHAAYVVGTATPYFPRGTIHVVVVDPGVGTQRKAVILKTADYIYIGPDNGCFSFVGEVDKIIQIPAPGEEVSSTFHGRDVFAPIAAKLACGYDPGEFGSEVDSYTKLRLTGPEIAKGEITGEVLCIDTFGNVITNINSELLNLGYGEVLRVKVKGREIEVPFLRTYGHAREGQLLALIGSSGYLELAVNRGDAAAVLGLNGGERLVIK